MASHKSVRRLSAIKAPGGEKMTLRRRADEFVRRDMATSFNPSFRMQNERSNRPFLTLVAGKRFRWPESQGAFWQQNAGKQPAGARRGPMRIAASWRTGYGMGRAAGHSGG